jgi:hypothetical protein
MERVNPPSRFPLWRDRGNRTLVKGLCCANDFLPEIVVEAWPSIAYINAMPQTVEERLECLEKEFSELRAQILNLRHRKKDWRSTFGTLEDDEITREAERLGREYREQLTYQKEIAGS